MKVFFKDTKVFLFSAIFLISLEVIVAMIFYNLRFFDSPYFATFKNLALYFLTMLIVFFIIVIVESEFTKNRQKIWRIISYPLFISFEMIGYSFFFLFIWSYFMQLEINLINQILYASLITFLTYMIIYSICYFVAKKRNVELYDLEYLKNSKDFFTIMSNFLFVISLAFTIEGLFYSQRSLDINDPFYILDKIRESRSIVNFLLVYSFSIMSYLLLSGKIILLLVIEKFPTKKTVEQ